ncbi:MAG: MauE/DoxX family redox-associated membrane protein [Desulfomonile sp.]
MKYAVLIARLLIGGLFVYASVYKITDPADFAVSIRNYMIIPAEWSNVVAMTLPWIEISAGLFLVVGILTRPAAMLTTGMMGLFLAAISYAYFIGLNIDCGCFSASSSSSGAVGVHHIIRDAALFLASCLILVRDGGHYSMAAKLKRLMSFPRQLSSCPKL